MNSFTEDAEGWEMVQSGKKKSRNSVTRKNSQEQGNKNSNGVNSVSPSSQDGSNRSRNDSDGSEKENCPVEVSTSKSNGNKSYSDKLKGNLEPIKDPEISEDLVKPEVVDSKKEVDSTRTITTNTDTSKDNKVDETDSEVKIEESEQPIKNPETVTRKSTDSPLAFDLASGEEVKVDDGNTVEDVNTEDETEDEEQRQLETVSKTLLLILLLIVIHVYVSLALHKNMTMFTKQLIYCFKN